MKRKKCINCKKNLRHNNKSQYCSNCYRHSPQYLEYQRIKQREFYKAHPEKAKAYNKRPDVQLRKKKYMKKYVKEHIVRIRKQKNEWAKRNKEKVKKNDKKR
jgi:hypothetical protein